MDPGPVPQQLQNSTVLEQQLFRRSDPATNLYMLKHGGLAAKCHCITFPQALNQPAQILPKLPQEVNVNKLKKKDTLKNSKSEVIQFIMC